MTINFTFEKVCQTKYNTFFEASIIELLSKEFKASSPSKQ